MKFPSLGPALTRRVLDSLPVPAVIIGRSRDVRWANRAATKAHGSRVESGGDFLALLPDGTLDPDDPESDWQLRAERIGWTLTETDEITVCIGSANAAHEEATRVLANVSHELRTPINGVLGLANVLSRRELPSESLELITMVERTATDMLEVVNGILDFSKARAAHFELDRASFDFHEMVEELGYLVRGRLRTGVELLFELDESSAGFLVTDPTRLRQVLLNLLSNAIKFTMTGSVTLRAHLRTGILSVAVIDTGIGIPREAQQTIFEPFAQADATTTRRFGGTGLGLAITRDLTEHLGGNLSLESEVGVGTSITVNIPVQVGHHRRSRTARRLPDQMAMSGCRGLIVEDDPVSQLVLRTFLGRFGVASEVVASGREAVEQATGEEYQIVFMDGRLPELDGFEASVAIRSAGVAVPIIGIAADPSFAARQRCLRSGMSDYLSKPICDRELFQMLRRWLGADYPRGHAAPPRLSAALTELWEEYGELRCAILSGQRAELDAGLRRLVRSPVVSADADLHAAIGEFTFAGTRGERLELLEGLRERWLDLALAPGGARRYRHALFSA